MSKAVLNAVLQGIGDVQVVGVSLLEQLRVYSNHRLKNNVIPPVKNGGKIQTLEHGVANQGPYSQQFIFFVILANLRCY